MGETRCPFNGGECDGGEIRPGGLVGCGYKAEPSGECAWAGDVPKGATPRDFYNSTVMEVLSCR